MFIHPLKSVVYALSSSLRAQRQLAFPGFGIFHLPLTYTPPVFYSLEQRLPLPSARGTAPGCVADLETGAKPLWGNCTGLEDVRGYNFLVTDEGVRLIGYERLRGR